MAKNKKEKEIIPHIIEPFRHGNTIIRKYEEFFEDEVGNSSINTYVDFKDKKGKINERFLLYVSWLKNKTELLGKEKEEFIKSFHNPIDELDNDYYDGYLLYYFEHNSNIYLAYVYDNYHKEGKTYEEFMIFELNEEAELSDNHSATPFTEDSFETRMQELYRKKMIKNYYYYKMYYDTQTKFLNEKVYVGKRAKYLCHLYIDQHVKIKE